MCPQCEGIGLEQTIDIYKILDLNMETENNKSFVGYTENGFNIDNHNNLFKIILNLQLLYILLIVDIHFYMDCSKT